MTAATTARADEIEVARGEWLSRHTGLTFAQVLLIEHYDPHVVSDWSLVRSLPADWHERMERAWAGYIEMLELRLTIARAAALAAQL